MISYKGALSYEALQEMTYPEIIDLNDAAAKIYEEMNKATKG